MITYVKIIQLVLSILDWLIVAGEENKWLAAGEARAIARQQAEILRKSEYGRKMLKDVEQLDDAQLDDELRKLEPGGER